MKIEKLTTLRNGISFFLGELQFLIEDTKNLKLSHHDGRYKNGFYMLKYHGVIAFLDKHSGDQLQEFLDKLVTD
ncbi:hypothetical protein [Acinetobacter ursingii]|uniref:hypothetical protein n=1 Tax=Acinetobacter ursingii TaxID=108980 RepID=UPI000CAFB324|nr:hypothetical protein CJ183_14020 [Acinetobacter ursingii]